MEATSKREGWIVKPSFEMPDGFVLTETDDHFLHLWFGTEHVAMFNANSAIPTLIQKAALAYKKARRK